MLREEEDPPCETTAEQYEPTSVDTVLGNPTVTLTAYVPGKGLVEVKQAPTAADIAGLSGNYYLNLEGEALGETCVYAKDFRRAGAGRQGASRHLRPHRPREGPLRLRPAVLVLLVLQPVQRPARGRLGGDADHLRSRLARSRRWKEEPSEIIVFQHAGGERADWDSSKVQKEGTHPIVYPAAGSHATFYDSAVYVQNGQNGSGLGCDVTTEPLRELRPQPVLLPERVPRTGEFEWLSYYGRWGEREEGYNNGPQGPQTKSSWREPFTWMSKQRTTSPQLPGGAVPGLGQPVAKAFCGAVAAASELVNLDIKSRPALIATLLGVALIIVLFVGLTRWRPIDLEQLQARRSFGQMVRTARQLYGRHWRVLVPVSLVAIPIVGGVNWLAGQVGTSTPAADGAGSTGGQHRTRQPARTIARPAAMAVVAALASSSSGFSIEARSGPGSAPRSAASASASGGSSAPRCSTPSASSPWLITIVGAPFAINKFVAWSFVKQEVLFHDRGFRDAFHGSADLVRGRWWHTVRFARLPLRPRRRLRPDAHLRADLHEPAADLGRPARLADLRPADPLRRPRRDAALPRPAGAGGDRAGEAAALVAAVEPRKFGRVRGDWTPLPEAAQPAPT